MSDDNIIEPLRAFAVPLDTLHLDPKNARKHDRRNIESIKASLTTYRQRQVLVVQREGMIVRVGNGRLIAMRELGWKEAAVIVVPEGDVDAAAYALHDNRTAELAEWDDVALGRVLAELRETEIDLSSLWDAGELDHLATATELGDLYKNQPGDDKPDDPAPNDDGTVTVSYVFTAEQEKIIRPKLRAVQKARNLATLGEALAQIVNECPLEPSTT